MLSDELSDPIRRLYMLQNRAVARGTSHTQPVRKLRVLAHASNATGVLLFVML